MVMRIVTATRLNERDFHAKSALGRSLSVAYGRHPFELELFPGNRQALARCYNRSIESGGDASDILLFVHGDVYLTDFFWPDRIAEGLASFSLVGVAGNVRRVPKQPSWAFVDDQGTWDAQANLSGIVGHGKGFPCELTVLGSVPRPCLLLDGVLLAARRGTLLEYGIRFDERFAFHFYDLDLCRQFERKGLPMGTIPLSIVHESVGAAGSADWRAVYAAYLRKWGG